MTMPTSLPFAFIRLALGRLWTVMPPSAFSDSHPFSQARLLYRSDPIHAALKNDWPENRFLPDPIETRNPD